MSAFRIERSRAGLAPLVYHESNNRLAVALILPEEDGTVTLFPVEWDRPPAPLTGKSETYPNVSAVCSLLGIEGEAP